MKHTAPENRLLVDVGIALMNPHLDHSLAHAASAIALHPQIESISIKAVHEHGECVDVSHGTGPSPAEKQGEEVSIPFAFDGFTGQIIVRLAKGVSRGNCAALFSALAEASNLIAHRIRTHELLVEMQDDQVLVDVLSTLSHDLRTPLTSIKGYATLLIDHNYEWEASERREFLDVIIQECEHIERLTASLLDATTEDKAFLVRKELVLMPPLLSKIIREHSFGSSGHRFVLDMPDDAREVLADPVGLEQVFRNLLDNAVKYSPEGSLVVMRARRVGGHVLVSIADQGNGIAPQHLNRLFERFYRIKDGTSRISGTGLGLPIARRIIEGHGGHIWAESTIGKGTTFYFKIPLADAPKGCAEVNPSGDASENTDSRG